MFKIIKNINKRKQIEKDIRRLEHRYDKSQSELHMRYDRRESELDNKYENRRTEINQEVLAYQQQNAKKMEKYALNMASEIAAYEHAFHLSMENKKVEIAKLESYRECLEKNISLQKDNILEHSTAHQKDLNSQKDIIKAKDDEIKRTNELCTLLVAENDPKLKQQNEDIREQIKELQKCNERFQQCFSTNGRCQ
jgi:hypothetical protein